MAILSQDENLKPYIVSAETTTTYNSAPTDPAYNPDTWNGNPPECADLRAIIEAWPVLPEAIRAGIVAMVQSVVSASDGS